MPISPLFTSRFAQRYTINFSECMPNGLLKHTEALDLLQHTASDHADLGGISFTDMQAHHQAWVMSRMRFEVSRMPRWQEQVEVRTWIVNLENSRSTRALEIRSMDGELLVGAETFWAVFNTKTRRPEALALPHEHFEKFGTEYPTAKRVKKVVLPELPVLAKRTVKLSDLDIVKHVNNLKYVEWCLDELPMEAILANKITAMDMNYAKELRYNDEVEIRGQETPTGYQMGIYRENALCFAFEVTLSN